MTNALGIGMGRKGRVGIAVPVQTLVSIISGGMAIILGVFGLILWGIAILWHELCWGIGIAILIRGVNRTIKAYKEGRYG